MSKMKVAIIGSDKIDSMEYHISDAFSELGHEVKIFDSHNFIKFGNSKLNSVSYSIDNFIRIHSDRYDQKKHNKIRSLIKNYEPELIVCFYRDIHPSLINDLKNDSNSIIHINPDAMTTLGYQQVFAANYDAWFTKDRYMARFMKDNMHLRTFIYNEAFNHRFNPKPKCDKREMEQKVNIEISTYGTLYPYRVRMLNEIRKGIDADFKIYGVKPHRFFNSELATCFTGEYIYGMRKSEVLYGSKIVLNNMHFAEIESVNCRFFEINGSGGFQLSDYRPILKELLPIDPELVSFKNTNEAISKIKYYLSHPDERYELASIIYQHFINNYTYDHLVQHVLDCLEL